MNSGAVGMILIVGFCYFVLTVLMPAIMFYRFVKDRAFLVRFAFYQVVGNIYVLLLGFVFSYLHIKSSILMLFFLIALPLLLKLLIGRPDLIGLVLDYFADKSKKIVTGVGTVYALGHFLKKKLKEAYYRYIHYHYLEIIILFLLAVFAIWYYGYFKMHYFTYASSDEATHLYWVNSFLAGNAFPAGIYPHSMHFMMAAIHSISGLQTIMINHYFSVTIMLVLHFMVFCTVKSLFRSSAAGIGASGLFLLSDMFIAQRYQNTLPMEYGMIAMLVMIVLLYDFMKRRDTLTMWAVAGATAWTFHSHFYITLFAVFIWIAFVLVYLKTIFRLEAFIKTFLAVILSIAIAIAPFAVGLFTGHKFEQSMDWALRMMGVQTNEQMVSTSEQNEELIEQEREEQKQKQEGLAKGENTETESVTQEEGTEPETVSSETPPEEEAPKVEKADTPYVLEFKTAKTVREYLRALAHLLMSEMIRGEGNAILLYFCLGFLILYAIGKLIWANLEFRKRKLQYLREGLGLSGYRKKKQEFLAQFAVLLAVPLFLIFCSFLYTMSYFGFPAVVEDSRAAMILSPLMALLFASPIALIEELLSLAAKERKNISTSFLLLALGVGLGIFFAEGPVKKLEDVNIYYVTQELSNKLSYDLIGTKPKNTWTVISPVNDLLAIHNYGYHYEVIDLLREIEDGNKDLTMPTNDLYVVVDKRIMDHDEVYYLPDYKEDLMKESRPIDPKQVDQNFYDLGKIWDPPETAYGEYRNVTMSKLYYWMEAMKKAYPYEVEVYAEDELCTVYHVRQSADFPLNLSWDYRDENFGMNAKADFEKRYREEHGTPYAEQ